MRRDPLFWVLSAILLIEWIILAFGVVDRQTWIIENIIPLLMIVPGIWYYRQGNLSKTSLVLFYIFLALHILGAHYTYSKVPYEQWLGFETKRNYYDRLIHFLFGFLLYLPLKDIFARYIKTTSWILITYVLLLLNTASMLYELIEWASTYVFGNGSADFLGTQGDEWDAHKDMALALLGSLLAVPAFWYHTKHDRHSR